ncbi:MAG: tyrosine-type recombinase/integrase [Anaerolineae bacterium]|nr:tyrosine-type recombinase/integrase [Anaerolineae bacterium]
MSNQEGKQLTEQFFFTTTIDLITSLDLYLNRGINEKTASNDTHRLLPFCSQFKGVPIQNITPNDIDIWVKKLKLQLGPVSVESYKQSMKAFFNWCVKNESIPLKSSPAQHLKPKRKTSSRYKAANPNDLTKIIKGLQSRIPEIYELKPQRRYNTHKLVVRDLLAFSLAMDSGKRLHELASITRRSINTALKNPILAQNGVVVYSAQAFGKTGAANLMFTEYTATIYRFWESIRGTSSSNFVFIALGGKHSGKPLTDSGFTTIFVRRAKEFGVATNRTHSIRHLVGTRTTDHFNPRVAATVLNITVETAIQHYYNEDSQGAVNAIALN